MEHFEHVVVTEGALTVEAPGVYEDGQAMAAWLEGAVDLAVTLSTVADA